MIPQTRIKTNLRTKTMIRIYCLRFCIVLLTSLYIAVSADAQDLNIKGVKLTYKSYGDELHQYFREYNLIRPHFSTPFDQVSGNQELDLTLQIEGLIDETISLTLHNLISSKHRTRIATAQGVFEAEMELIKTYAGNIPDDPTSQVRLAIRDAYLYGYIKTGQSTIWIEPAKTFDASLPKNTLVVYLEKDVIKDSGQRICASNAVNDKVGKIAPSQKAITCQTVELAIAMDYSYVTAASHNTTQEAINQTIALMNLVEGDYTGAFNSDIRFEIVEHYASECSTCDPWGSSLDAGVLLDNFTNWGPTGFSANHDLGQFWTAQDIWATSTTGEKLYAVAGLAWVGVVCGSARYHVLEEFSTTQWSLRVLTSHEIGHNFGSGHDSSDGNIMAASITQNTSSWSAQSISVINDALGGYACLDQCLTGSCSEITGVVTSGCNPGSPSTYDLYVTILHGGGGNAAGFDLLVGGNSYYFPWSVSPQTILIPNLEATGEINQTLSVAATDGSDGGCQGSVTYNVPNPDCSLVEIENFDACTLPLGWQSTTTNNLIINGGDPLVQYNWKFLDANRTFANYDNSSNTGSLLTIDGTCMAVMDDDIFDPTWYSGIVTLTSPYYNTIDYDQVIVEFDYNFHSFEDGKSINESNFTVDAWNGTSYVNILTDEDSTCPWYNVWQSQCTTHATIDVTAYQNDQFHLRFVYSDGDNGKWTGMVALDNFKLTGTVVADPCVSFVTISSTSGGGQYVAEMMIQSEGTVLLSQATVLDAPEIELYPGFEVPQEVEVTINNDGCQSNQ